MIVAAGWAAVAVVAFVVAAVCAVLLVVVGVIGARRRSSSGPLVVVGRVMFSLLLLAVAVALGSALWGAVAGAVDSLA